MWRVEVERGRGEDFHRREMPADLEPSVWWFEVQQPTLVIGSAQPIDHIDLSVCEREGIDVVRRRSGGGAVLMRPGDSHWVDVLIPRSHARWTDDVGESAWWLGDVWRQALAELGVEGTDVHRGPMVTTMWSRQVCFAGLGGGEVVIDGHKVVGISQRRSRQGARFQCIVYRQWDAEAHARLFSPPAPTASDLAGLAVPIDRPADVVRAALVAALSAD